MGWAKRLITGMAGRGWAAPDPVLLPRPLDPQDRGPLPPHPAAGFRELDPIEFPITGDAGEEAGVRGHPLRPAQNHAAPVNQHDFRNGLFAVRYIAAAVTEIKQLARERKLAKIFRRRRLGVVEEREDFRAGIHPVNDLGFNRQDFPDELANAGCFIVEHLCQHGFPGGNEGQSKVSA